MQLLSSVQPTPRILWVLQNADWPYMHGSANLQHASILFHTTHVIPPIRHKLVDHAYFARHYPIILILVPFSLFSGVLDLGVGYGRAWLWKDMAMPVNLNLSKSIGFGEFRLKHHHSTGMLPLGT